MAHVLVAGAAGFLASHLVDRLLSDGHTVVGIDNFITGNAANLAHLNQEPRFEFIEADACKPLVIPGRFEQVYHLASPASPIDYLELPFETLYVGSDGTRNLLERALADNARFLITSTSEVYGDPTVHPQHEGYWGNVNPIGPRSVYDEAKRYSEALTMAFHRYKKLQTRISRLFNTYGPRMRFNDGRVIPAFCTQALRGDELTIQGDGSQTRSYCYVSDTVDGLVRLMASDLSEPCNLGNPYELSVLELAKVIRDRVGSSSEITFRPLPKDDPKRRKPDCSRAKRELNWEPKVAFEDGIAKTLDYFKTVI